VGIHWGGGRRGAFARAHRDGTPVPVPAPALQHRVQRGPSGERERVDEPAAQARHHRGDLGHRRCLQLQRGVGGQAGAAVEGPHVPLPRQPLLTREL